MTNTDLILEQSRCISHEIRNHLSICEIYTQIIKKNLEDANIENTSINNALECISKSLKIMCNSLLDLKSLNNINPKNCDIKQLLEEGTKLAQVYIHDKDIKIKCNLKNTCTAYVDENKFLACIVNIIKNAIEAIPEKGEIKISLDVKGNFAHIKISNNGTPISKDKQKTIFEEGYTTKSTGSGLGLHICLTNLKAQNALLKLNKSNSEITEFEIDIPTI